MRHLLPTPPEETPIPSERDQLIQRLMGNTHPVQPLQQECSSFTDMEILLQNLLPVGSPVTEEPQPTERQNRSTVVCFSCGEPGHAASRCPTLNETFPFLPTGWQADWVGDGYVMRSLRMMADRRRMGNVDWSGEGVNHLISNDCGPHNPADNEGFTAPAARDQVISRERAARPTETIVPLGGAAVNDIRQLMFWFRSIWRWIVVAGGGGVGFGPCGRDRCVVRGWMTLIGLYLIVFRTFWSPGVPRRSICLIWDMLMRFCQMCYRSCLQVWCAGVLAHGCC